MSSFIANNQTYNIVTENELATVLSHYSSEFVFSIVDNAMKQRFTSVPILSLANVVSAWELNFKSIIAQYGSESVLQVSQVRTETYQEIINAICREFNLSFTVSDNVDLYTAAFHMYNFFVSGFHKYLSSFFANYIYKERNSIYDSFGLSDLKKNKDTSTLYGKKLYKDIRLAVINANIDRVISGMSIFDIDLYNIFMNSVEDKSIAGYLASIVSSNDNFFETAYANVLNTDLRPVIITNIRFKLQELSIDPNNVADIINDSENSPTID